MMNFMCVCVCVSIVNCYPWDANKKAWIGRSNNTFYLLCQNKHKILNCVLFLFSIVFVAKVKENQCTDDDDNDNVLRIK